MTDQISKNRLAAVVSFEGSTDKLRSCWECGLSQVNTPWVLLIRSNEIITGQLRKSIAEKIKTNGNNPCQHPLKSTIIFLKKRLK